MEQSRKVERWGKPNVVLLLSIVDVRRVTVSVSVQVLNTSKYFNMNETKKVLFFSMLPISGRALLYWKVTDFALFFVNKSPTRCSLFHFIYFRSTCFGHGACPSSGVVCKNCRGSHQCVSMRVVSVNVITNTLERCAFCV